MTDQQFQRIVQAVKWLMGGLAVIAAFLLVQPDGTIPQVVEIALGAFLAFAAYVNPASLVSRAKPAG